MERRIASFETCDKEFWNNIEKLRKISILFSKRTSENSASLISTQDQEEASTSHHSNNLESGSKCNERNSKEELLAKINKILADFVHNRGGKKSTALAIPNRRIWKNTDFEKNEGIKLVKNPILKMVGRNNSSTKRLALMLHMLIQIHKLIEMDTYKTKRELYYDDVTLYKSQSIVDRLLDDIACLLNVSKIHLHVLTTSKGCIAGRLRFRDEEGNYIDCSEAAGGILIPNNIQRISNIQSDARFILVVEKSAVFEMLLDSDITFLLHPCIIVTGKGFPDVNTREMLKKLSDHLRIPILGLFDADPYGIEILGIYKYGSLAMAFDVKNLAVPEMRWLGLLPTDIQRLNLPLESTVPLSENDKKKANHLLDVPYMQHNKQWNDEVLVMLKTEKKAEIEGLGKLNAFFLPSIYLPNKIKYGGWI